jgi:hypothetical protein
MWLPIVGSFIAIKAGGGENGIYYRAMLFDCSKLLNHTYVLSGAESHGECATFGVLVWVEAFGAELLFLLNKKR